MTMAPRYAPAVPLPPAGYVPGHDLPHPVNDPTGHLHASRGLLDEPQITRAGLPMDSASRRHALAALLIADARWRHAVDLFNAGFAWEAHEAWEGFWQARGCGPSRPARPRTPRKPGGTLRRHPRHRSREPCGRGRRARRLHSGMLAHVQGTGRANAGRDPAADGGAPPAVTGYGLLRA
ncbi:MAG: DUF309 domain-containing protein [Planctomycetes bacterium]|nr:DUF309 domain-containing protein [Planctomycetota bacterium]